MAVQSNNKPDNTLINNILQEIRKNMDTTVASQNKDVQGGWVTLTNGKKESHDFYRCFILTWDNTYTNVISVDLISFVEKN